MAGSSPSSSPIGVKQDVVKTIWLPNSRAFTLIEYRLRCLSMWTYQIHIVFVCLKILVFLSRVACI